MALLSNCEIVTVQNSKVKLHQGKKRTYWSNSLEGSGLRQKKSLKDENGVN